jgi:2-C-methyl-D-erythritol 4-phosphate cytidylyltransferase
MKNIAIILAGGTGQRLGSVTPKQFIKLAGKKVIEHTINVFQQNKYINEICVVVHPDYVREMDEIRLNNNFNKLTKVLNGGTERYESSLAAINAYKSVDEECNLIFHDAVRPLVNDRIIDDVVNALCRYDAVDVAVPTTDTIIQVDDDSEIVKIPPRRNLRNGQTPQAFKLSVIEEAYRRALLDPKFRTTDDCGVVLKYMPETPIFVVDGAQFNIKLTYKEDSFLLDKLFQLKSTSGNLTALSSDDVSDLKGKAIIIFGGTSGIGYELAQICKEYGMNVRSVSRSTGVDVTSVSEVSKALAKAAGDFGKIDFVVNSAGVLDRQPLKDMSEDVIRRSIDTNYLGCVNVSRVSYEYLKESKGSLLFYTSSSYTRGRAMYSIYSSLKAAIVNLVQALCEEWFDDGIRVNCVNPERTKTPMRVKNFGNEPEESLLSPKTVAVTSLKTLLSSMTGEVIDVKRV